MEKKTEEKITELVGDHKRAVELEKHTGELCEATNHTRDSIHLRNRQSEVN